MKRGLRTPSLVALALAVGSHGVVFVLLFYAAKHVRDPAQSNSRSSELVFLVEPKEPERNEQIAIPERLSTAPTLASQPRDPSSRTQPRSTDEEGADTTASPRVDWQLEAEAVARQRAPELLAELRKKCEPDEGVPPPECRRRNYEFEWDPEPKKAGFAGALPYVRLGKRCIVGLGFFGCAIGELPKANGDLFEHMRDPDRPRGSVPEELEEE